MNTAQHLHKQTRGEIINTLGILTEDHRGFHPSKFFEYSPYSRAEVAKQAGVARSNLYKDTVSLSTLKQLKKGILQVVIGLDFSIELFSNNVEEALKWFNSPNTMLSGESPFEVCLRGDGESILNWLKARLGHTDAKAF